MISNVSLSQLPDWASSLHTPQPEPPAAGFPLVSSFPFLQWLLRERCVSHRKRVCSFRQERNTRGGGARPPGRGCGWVGGVDSWQNCGVEPLGSDIPPHTEAMRCTNEWPCGRGSLFRDSSPHDWVLVSGPLCQSLTHWATLCMALPSLGLWVPSEAQELSLKAPLEPWVL